MNGYDEDLKNHETNSETPDPTADIDTCCVIGSINENVEELIEQLEELTETQGEILLHIQSNHEELIAHITEPRPFLTTPFDEYSVIEGYALMFFILFIITIMYQFVRRFI
jgi:hypothetical protein